MGGGDLAPFPLFGAIKEKQMKKLENSLLSRLTRT